jgi:phosphatidylserine decarboxylase
MSGRPSGHSRQRAGRWLPNQDALENWLEGLVSEVRGKADEVMLHPVIDELRQLIDGDPVVRMYDTQMIEQVPQANGIRGAAGRTTARTGPQGIEAPS